MTTKPLVAIGSLALLALAGCGGANDAASETPEPAATVTVAAAAEPAPTVTVTRTVTVEPENDEADRAEAPEEAEEVVAEDTGSSAQDETSGQSNARGSAESYLDYSAFSRQGLIEQLEYEGFSAADAEHAIDSLGVDWSEQAVKSAESYLEYSSFSLQGLIDQLVYEGFTDSQAEYGANQAY